MNQIQLIVAKLAATATSDRNSRGAKMASLLLWSYWQDEAEDDDFQGRLPCID